MAVIGRMDIRESLADFGDFINSEEMTHRQAAIIVAVWTGATALFGIIAYIYVFIILGY